MLAKRWSINLSLQFVGFIVGIPVGGIIFLMLSRWHQFSIGRTVSLQIDPVGIVSLAVTVIIGLYVSRQLTKRDELSKANGELLVKYFNGFLEDSELFIKKVAVAEVKQGLTSIRAPLKRLRSRSAMLIELGKKSELLQANSVAASLLSQSVAEIYIALTDSPRRGTSTKHSTKVSDNKVSFSNEKVDEINQKFLIFQEAMFGIIVEITNGSIGK